MLADRLQCGVAGDRDGRSLLEAHVVRLRQEAIWASDGVLGKGPAAGAEHLLSRLELRHLRPNRLDASGHVIPEQRVLRGADPEARQAHHVRRPRHQVPYPLIDARCMHAHQHVRVARDRLVNVRESQNVDRAVRVPNDRLHRVPRASLPSAGSSPKLAKQAACSGVIPEHWPRSGFLLRRACVLFGLG